MPSLLRNSILPSSIEISAIVRKAAPSPPQKKQKMSLTQTYYLAHTARGKLSKEAARADHNLGRLVGHANLLDGLMLDLADAEREQENWFNQTVKGATQASDSPRHIQWAHTVESAIEEDEDEDEYSDNESDSDDEVEQIPQIPARRLRQEVVPTPIVTIEEDSDEEMMDDDDHDEGEELTLTRTHSNQPPELLHESDSESDDDMPPSPPQPEIPLDAFSAKQRQAIATTGFYQSRPEAVTSAEDQASFVEEGFFIPPRQQAPSISAF